MENQWGAKAPAGSGADSGHVTEQPLEGISGRDGQDLRVAKDSGRKGGFRGLGLSHSESQGVELISFQSHPVIPLLTSQSPGG